jgi:hypothetical protein
LLSLSFVLKPQENPEWLPSLNLEMVGQPLPPTSTFLAIFPQGLKRDSRKVHTRQETSLDSPCPSHNPPQISVLE